MNPPPTASRPSADTLAEFLGTRQETRRTRIIRTLKWGVPLLAVLVVVGWLAWPSDGAVRYATAPVETGDLRVTITATGNLEPRNQVTVGSELSGLVAAVLVDVNDRVTAGQPLARLDTQRLDDALLRSEAALASARANVSQAEASLAQAKANLDRQERLYARGVAGSVLSRSDIDTVRLAHARADAELRIARANVQSAQAQLSSDRTSLDKATLRSPVDGVVLVRNVEPGQTVAASFNAPELFVIAEDLARMEAKVKVDEADVAQVRDGAEATFTVDAWPGRTFPATIQRVDFGASSTATTGATSAATASSVVSYTTVLDVANPDLSLRPGMTATATLVASEEKGVLLVPNAALRYRPSTPAVQRPTARSLLPVPRPPGNARTREAEIARGSAQTVYVLDAQGKPTPVTIKVGASNGSQSVVVEGALRAGVDVVTGELVAP
jgi:HlyD family secretion protein